MPTETAEPKVRRGVCKVPDLSWCVLFEMQDDGETIAVARPIAEVPPEVLDLPRVIYKATTQASANTFVEKLGTDRPLRAYDFGSPVRLGPESRLIEAYLTDIL